MPEAAGQTTGQDQIEDPVTNSAVEDNVPKDDLTADPTVESEPEKEAKTVEEDQVEMASDDEQEDEHDEIASSDDAHKDEHDDEEEEEEVDYHHLSDKDLIAEFSKLLRSRPVQSIRKQVEEIRSEFNARYHEELEEQKKAFLEEGGNIIDFHYTTPLRKEFNSLYFEYREKKNRYYTNLKRDLEANLEKREELIEELKSLLSAEENINTTYKHFKDIQERWHTAGPIPRDKYNLVWNNYHHHVENFYDFLHLNREFRDMDFKNNLEQKLKIISRAEELQQEENIPKAFRELQMLHKMWKEEIGPVAKEYRDDIWDRFSEATRVMHERRKLYMDNLEAILEENYLKKQALIEAIKEAAQLEKPSHQRWQNAIKKVQELRDRFFALGKVPRNKNKEVWEAFKESTRSFNREKNNFYKEQKKEQYKNLEKKRELLDIANANKDSDDFETVTPLMKKIQADWKKIGHVPRKDSNKIWKEFKAACNHYFDRVHTKKNAASEEEMAHLKAKEALLEELKALKVGDDPKAELKLLKEKIRAWKAVGRVPRGKNKVEQQFNKLLDGLFKKLKIGTQEAELIKFENKVSSMVSQEDERQLDNEQFFIRKKIDEAKSEIRQLENNLGFFQHVDESNPLVQDVHKNIDRHKEQLDVWKAKLKRIKSLRKD
jgi:hypothetical protein